MRQLPLRTALIPAAALALAAAATAAGSAGRLVFVKLGNLDVSMWMGLTGMGAARVECQWLGQRFPSWPTHARDTTHGQHPSVSSCSVGSYRVVCSGDGFSGEVMEMGQWRSRSSGPQIHVVVPSQQGQWPVD